MKRTIFIEILLLFTLSVAIVTCTLLLRFAINMSRFIQQFPDYFVPEDSQSAINYALTYGILALLSAIAIFIAIIILAIKDFPCFKPLINKLNAKRAARKEQRDQAKAEQAAIAKQDRIDKLQAELNELRKDE